ncbi:S8 family serine peptidase [Planctomycetales bacterium ZRK34]|nr:S8 family serine peptidase [Planctomycetales bacterium ZRK34]
MNANILRRVVTTLGLVLWLVLAAKPAYGQSVAHTLIGADQVADLYPWLDGVNETTGLAQRVAVLDTGIQFNHSAFDDRIITGINYAAGATWGSTDAAAYTDLNGHGTFVAGVIGSTADQAPGLVAGVEFVSVRIADSSGSSSLTNLLMGLQWVNAHAAEYNITAVNVSLGTTEVYALAADVPDSPIYTAIASQFAQLAARDIVSVVGSGNTGSTTGLSMPAITDDVVSVGASTSTDTVASMTNRNDQLELLAPGVNITSTWINNAFYTGSGTSYATPFVTAAAVLLRDALETSNLDLHGSFETYQAYFVDLLQAYANPIEDPATNLTFARLNLLAALQSILPTNDADIPGAVYVPEPASAFILLLAITSMTRRPRSARHHQTTLR